jgi:uncharacterized membrane protein
VADFRLFSKLVLQYVSSAHHIAFWGKLPVVKATYAVILVAKPVFWFFAVIGSIWSYTEDLFLYAAGKKNSLSHKKNNFNSKQEKHENRNSRL